MSNMPGLEDIIGKTIHGVVFKDGESKPKNQLFIVFEDGTHIELYTLERDLNFIKELRSGGIEWVEEYVADESEITFDKTQDDEDT